MINSDSILVGTHKQDPGYPNPVESGICILCDKTLYLSGYGTDPKTFKTYKMDATKMKLIAMECGIELMGLFAHALQKAQVMKELLKKDEK